MSSRAVSERPRELVRHEPTATAVSRSGFEGVNFLALDVSAASTGWALCMEGDIRECFAAPDWLEILDRLRLSRTSSNWRVFADGQISVAHGAWRLKTEWSREGEPHAVLQRNLALLHRTFGFEHIVYESALTEKQRGGKSNPHNDVLVELIGHVKSFHFAKRCRTIQGIHRASWQRDFIGPQKRGTKRKTLLDLIEQRARQLGFVFRKDDEAAAIGLLTYAFLSRQMTPPWLADEVLRPMLVAGGAR